MENGTLNDEWKTLPGLSNTKKQLFWVAYGRNWCTKYHKYLDMSSVIRSSVHSLGPIRISGVLQNLEEFAKDFNCPRGSYMNPVKKCPRIW